MDKMDQAMIDALLASAAGDADQEETEENTGEALNIETEATETEDKGSALEQLMTEIEEEPAEEETEDKVSALEQLMTEIEEEPAEADEEQFSEEDIDALLEAAKNSSQKEPEEAVELPADSDAAELEALLGMADNENGLDEDSKELLRMLQEAEDATPDSMKPKAEEEKEKVEEKEEGLEIDEAALEAVLAGENMLDISALEEGNGVEAKEKKEKKPFYLKKFISTIFSALTEEIPEDELLDGSDIDLSEENKRILDELDQEDDAKIKAKEEKKKKEKKKKEKKPKKEKPKKPKKPKKEKKTKPADTLDPSSGKKIPRKKIIVTFIFGLSLLALILILETFVPPVLTQSRARKAYDSGEYYEAYKEYYGQNLSEEDEIRFEGAAAILRIQSNLDGYYNYVNMDSPVKAIHSLLETVRLKEDIFENAEKYNVLSKVREIYEEILGILSNEYQLSEEAALELTEEESDAVYTRKLESLAGLETSAEESSEPISEEDILPEEEEMFQN